MYYMLYIFLHNEDFLHITSIIFICKIIKK